MIIVNVVYVVKEGLREEFFSKVKSEKIIEDSKNESGNIKYEYYYPVENDNALFLNEIWKDEEARQLHSQTKHYEKLKALKLMYVVDTQIDIYNCN